MIKCENECEFKNGEFICCRCCPDRDTCEGACSEHPNDCKQSTFDEESALTAFRSGQTMVLMDKIVSVVRMKKECEEQEKALKDALKEAMQKYGIKKFDSDLLSIVFVDETTSTQLDSTKLKKKYPEIAEECQKSVTRSAYVKVTVKEAD